KYYPSLEGNTLFPPRESILNYISIPFACILLYFSLRKTHLIIRRTELMDCRHST
ncbi:unnamed protein product, partial [Staurois parvus]